MMTLGLLLQSSAEGPYELPAIVGCSGLHIDQDPALVRLHLIAENGQEFFAPLSDTAIRSLRDHLVGLLGPSD
jgi:hypothetical protein